MVKYTYTDDELMKRAISIYENHGQDAVIKFGEKMGLKFRLCGSCEIETPVIAGACAVCGGYFG